MKYTLEPAGTHGVWGLDDHSFLPYIFGSAQYGPAIKPVDPVPTEGSLKGATDPGNVAKTKVVEQERHRNLYFEAIGFIYDVKKGPFWEHSPTLYDISGVRAGWAKINKVLDESTAGKVLLIWLGHAQDVRRGSSWEVPRGAAFSIRIFIQLRPRSACRSARCHSTHG